MSIYKYIKRMNPQYITGVTCADCLKDTEDTIDVLLSGKNIWNLSFGERLWYETYALETLAFIAILNKSSPKNILDVGSGYGRVINLIKINLPMALVTGTENVKETYDVLTQRFQNIQGIDINQGDVKEFLKVTNRHFDMATCLMNTYGNINDEELFSSVMNHSDKFVFSLYNPKYDALREKMYRTRCHKSFKYRKSKKQYEFLDPWSNVQVSKSYTGDEIHALVERANGKITMLKQVGILYFCIAEKIN